MFLQNLQPLHLDEEVVRAHVVPGHVLFTRPRRLRPQPGNFRLLHFAPCTNLLTSPLPSSEHCPCDLVENIYLISSVKV